MKSGKHFNDMGLKIINRMIKDPQMIIDRKINVANNQTQTITLG